MKTTAMAHQDVALRHMENRAYYGLFMEQGTGKTWTILADVERLFKKNNLNALLVIAPNGVHSNWIRREIPEHLEIPVVARAWRSGAGKKLTKQIHEVFDPTSTLRVLAINIDALNTKAGFEICMRFLTTHDAMLVIDESSRIKNPDAGRTKACMKLKRYAKYRRIASGTPVTNKPVDVFAQMQFLESGLLETNSYRAFVAEYAELMSSNHPMMAAMIEKNPRIARAQIVAKNPDGTPKWRNLERLQKLLLPHSFRVLKKDCLDLPDKIYKTHGFSLPPKQRKAYKFMEDEFRMEFGGEVKPVQALSAAGKLQQITSGFLLHEEVAEYISEDNPRLKALMDLIEDLEGSFIIWAKYREELRCIEEALDAAGVPAVAYHGGVKGSARDEAVDRFQDGSARAFVGQPQAGGLGLTLTAAETVIYYSNDFNLETRLQSEDRAHRKGTKKNVVYIDIVAEDTIDESIATALQRKQNMAAAIMGDLT